MRGSATGATLGASVCEKSSPLNRSGAPRDLAFGKKVNRRVAMISYHLEELKSKSSLGNVS